MIQVNQKQKEEIKEEKQNRTLKLLLFFRVPEDELLTYNMRHTCAFILIVSGFIYLGT